MLVSVIILLFLIQEENPLKWPVESMKALLFPFCFTLSSLKHHWMALVNKQLDAQLAAPL